MYSIEQTTFNFKIFSKSFGISRKCWRNVSLLLVIVCEWWRDGEVYAVCIMSRADKNNIPDAWHDSLPSDACNQIESSTAVYWDIT